MEKMETVIDYKNNFLSNKLKFECFPCAKHSFKPFAYIHSADSHSVFMK